MKKDKQRYDKLLEKMSEIAIKQDAFVTMMSIVAHRLTDVSNSLEEHIKHIQDVEREVGNINTGIVSDLNNIIKKLENINITVNPLIDLKNIKVNEVPSKKYTYKVEFSSGIKACSDIITNEPIQIGDSITTSRGGRKVVSKYNNGDYTLLIV